MSKFMDTLNPWLSPSYFLQVTPAVSFSCLRDPHTQPLPHFHSQCTGLPVNTVNLTNPSQEDIRMGERTDCFRMVSGENQSKWGILDTGPWWYHPFSPFEAEAQAVLLIDHSTHTHEERGRWRTEQLEVNLQLYPLALEQLAFGFILQSTESKTFILKAIQPCALNRSKSHLLSCIMFKTFH